MEQIRIWLLGKCRQRFYEFLSQIQRNNDIISCTKSDRPMRTWPMSKKSKLIILDVDETVLDQQTNSRMMVPLQPYNYWEDLHFLASTVLNAKDLKFSFHRTQMTQSNHQKSMDSETSPDFADLPHFAHFVVFRKYVIELIHECRRNTNFIVYSLLNPLQIIPHLILIEMYYNFVSQIRYHTLYRVRRPLNIFKFEYLIGSPQPMLRKSMLTVSEMIGDLRGFEEIYIVDNRGPQIWNDRLPPTAKIYPVQPSRFEISAICDKFEDLINVIKRERAEDEFFAEFIDFVVKLSQDIAPGNQNGTLLWTRNLKNTFILSNGTTIRRDDCIRIPSKMKVGTKKHRYGSHSFLDSLLIR